MPKISISCSIPVKDIEATKFLHKNLGWGLSSASRMLMLGEKGFFYTCQLYLSDHLEHDKKIRAIIDFFHKKNIPLTILEIGDDDDWGDIGTNFDLLKITDEQMLNELNSSEDYDG
ncbi:hypothetical protein [Pseudomonas capsici]|uniref:DUF695 domain-containing protein n=1 Tax=Pseudomonas capsici TaxID=2810614 RepID=A0ABT3C4J5_9PSED|nr:hypothetical protein [Pseudomonas capsici]MBN6717153.1 hypothetical protein [Pseudomonas capsici]MBN6722217.1 hypothetical protein [Pseudomonas capsici]MBN6727115.1 hypothetical protein [Pseudomonas capsici]MCV4270982.1 hypothetical protein [Pseudomonas capsici]MCV4281111.1 hypothetical protein [Pseudomonas capsici]